MKLADAIEGGIAGASTLTLLEKALQNMDTKPPKMKFLNKPGIIKRLKKKSKKKGKEQLFIEVAKELLAAGANSGVFNLSKKKYALLRGALLGAATGLGVVLLDKKDKNSNGYHKRSGTDNGHTESQNELTNFWMENQNKILTVGLYTLGGVVAAATIKKTAKKKKKK